VKILFISRATLYKDTGGDTVQVVNTARYLEKIGVQATIKLCNEKIDYLGYDLIHFFNIIRPADILIHIEKSGKPYVVSTIYVDYGEFEKKMRKGIAGFFFRLFPPDLIEYVKVIGRVIANGEKIISPSYLFLGQKKSIRKIVKGAAMLLPNSKNEYIRLQSHYKVSNAYSVIPNAIDPILFSRFSQKVPRDERLILCVGRIEGRKNQLNLIKALNETIYKLIIIGSPSANQIHYYNTCKTNAGSNICFVNGINQEALVEYYNKAKVHVLPSWFETTGLSSLEAAAMGCNIVITDKGDTKEYFEEYAYYCDPGSPASILEAVEKAASEEFNEQLREKIFTHYTWLVTAQETLKAYNNILGQRN
jgi:glycosyltransferase involved in cell wall biosynthesis